MRRSRSPWPALLLALAAAGSRASDPAPDSATPKNGDLPPSIEFLEFLGEWESDGELVDPLDLDPTAAGSAVTGERTDSPK